MANQNAATKMDAIYKYQRYFYNLTRKYYLLGRDTMLCNLRPEPNQTVLEIGCGTGRNLIKTAQLYPKAQLFGFDVSNAMLNTARQSVGNNNIKLAQGDATNFTPNTLFGLNNFDKIFISYTLSMIPDWQKVLPCALNALAQNGELHIVDFGMQEHLPHWFKAMLYGWLARFSVYPTPLQNTLQQLAHERSLKLKYHSLYRGYAIYAVLKRL